jgi:hypothetical protein
LIMAACSAAVADVGLASSMALLPSSTRDLRYLRKG